MASKIKVDQIQTADGTGTIALQNQLSGMTTASLPALGSAQMPTGAVLKVERSSTAGNASTTSTSYTKILTHSYTPVSSNSKIYVQVFFEAYNANTNTTAGMLAEVRRAGTNIGVADKAYAYTSTTADRFQVGTVGTGEYTNTSTTAADYELWFKSYYGGNVATYDPYMIITEVAG